MSVLDDFRAAEQRVAQRLKELEPSVAEYRELESIAQRLGLDVSAVTAEPASTAPAGRSRPRRARSSARRKTPATNKASAGLRPRAPSGGREQRLLELVRARPGVTVREAGAEIGVDPTSLYRVVHKLEENGQVRKAGRGLEPVSASS